MDDEQKKNEQLRDELEIDSGKSERKTATRKKPASDSKRVTKKNPSKYPRDTLEQALRIPRSILEQNAGQPCSVEDAARYMGVGCNGPFKVLVGSAKKYGLLKEDGPGIVALTDLARQILRPQTREDEISGLRTSVQTAPEISDVYSHYRGELIPERKFFANKLMDTYGILEHKTEEFSEIFFSTLRLAELLDETGGKIRLLDVSENRTSTTHVASKEERRLRKAVTPNSSDTCFVMMPFGGHLGTYYEAVYKPAVKQAGLTPIRADADIFGTGKIIDQIYRGIVESKVLIAELTSRNPNVFYELGLAHALRKPVVLVSSNDEDVPFDLKHIRCIHYDMKDPFWGEKLIDKVTENVLSALQNPEEALFSVEEQS
ncbi:nucleoside 2-deoxyribosyltransferase [Parvularcula sp. BGMRC 0090]|uniref:Nucleoside 2-deoxyribosyltransferase n=2 Tax=Parvularcula maris TaxID=2965077 RepID=A0A9X2L961_9PROT|nr:nucleoside 2-deoxyribosyltransferase [Parvularcula maris]